MSCVKSTVNVMCVYIGELQWCLVSLIDGRVLSAIEQEVVYYYRAIPSEGGGGGERREVGRREEGGREGGRREAMK